MNKLIAVPVLALAAGLSLAACGTTAVTAPPATHAASAPAAAPPVIINNNNNPAPAPTVYVPVQAPVGPVAQTDPWSVTVAYYTAINSGNNWTAWKMLSSSVQQGWNGNYNTYVANFTPLAFENVTYASESGDSVTFTFTLRNVQTGWTQYTTCTFTVDNGIITSST